MRCIRAVKSLVALEAAPIRVVALYTDVDRDAPFVRHADVTARLDVKTTPVAAYLDHALLIDVLEKVGADAVWPGWGFVAEDPAFVDAVTDAGIRFLGPTAKTMRALGDKISSKVLAEKISVPISAWTGGEVTSVDEAHAAAQQIGLPVVIKASAGGGGRGIRVVKEAGEIESAFTSAKAEAKSAFGDGRLFIEKLISGGRHVEVQIAADRHGNVLALGCRDCSVQRRHQKVIEEAPPIGLSSAFTSRLKRSAVDLAREVDYQGVGTVEFLVQGEQFFFLEMNPRLQVEHGITEEVSGTDLVQLQIRIARGEELAPEIQQRGYSIEARVCAEDPDAGFLPAPGRVARFDPALGPRIRVDSGVTSGSAVPPDFDSLIAKVIANGDTREEARARLVSALRDFDLVIEGGATNKSYLLELLAADEYREGGVDTTWLDRWNAQRGGHREHSGEALVLAAILSYQTYRSAARANFYSDLGAITPEAIPASEGQERNLVYAGKPYKINVYAAGDGRYRVHLDGRVVTARLAVSGKHAARMRIAGQDLRVLYDITDASIRSEIEGHVHVFSRQTAGQVRAATPSMIVALHIEVGDRVKARQPLGLLEAMKMEISFDAPVAGTVVEVKARKGQQVGAGDVILIIDNSGESGGSGASDETLSLPEEVDPLAALFTEAEDGGLGDPDIQSAMEIAPRARRAAMSAVTEEIRRIIIGYDKFEPRVEKLIRFLSAPIPDGLQPEFLIELSEARNQLVAYADIEALFSRTQRASPTGELEPSNNANMRTYTRRLRAAGAGMSEDFLDSLKRALLHYGIETLEHDEFLERIVLRLFASQRSDLRARLVSALLRRVMALAREVDLEEDVSLHEALTRIASMRGQVPHDVADLATDAAYKIFVRPQLDRAAEQTTQQLERWMTPGTGSAPPHDALFTELALAPEGWFRRVEAWMRSEKPRRREIALAAYVRRLYAPQAPHNHRGLPRDGFAIDRLEFRDFVALAALCAAPDISNALETLLAAAQEEHAAVVELVVSIDELNEESRARRTAAKLLEKTKFDCRVTVSFVRENNSRHHSWVGADSCGTEHALYGMHPRAAERVELQRYESFELERLPAPSNIYCFYGKSRTVPDDERIFVLADVRGRPPKPGPEAANYLPMFERAFHQATGALRSVLGRRDPRRKLQWNRIALFLQHPIALDGPTTDVVSRRLHPATRHLGLERVTVRLSVLDPNLPEKAPRPVEVVISDQTGSNMEIAWREPHRNPLEPASHYARSVVAAKSRGLIYPYELIRLLTTSDADGNAIRPSALPAGDFEEYDLDPEEKTPRPISVSGREPGLNRSAVVFGVISTPTKKVPEGMRRVLVLSDPTRGMGALAAAECDRVLSAINLAEELGLPVEWVPVSSGAKIAMNSGTENLDATARVVRRIVTFTEAGGVINIIVGGVNVGAQSYWDALSTMLMHTKGALIMTPRASMVLTGRMALAASGSVSAEDEVTIGGYERVMGINGQAQYYARDVMDAYRILYDHYDYTYVPPGETTPRRHQTKDPIERAITEADYINGNGFQKVGEIFDSEINPGRKRPFSMRALMTSVIDQDGGHLERWQSLVSGETAIVWDAHLGGHPVCLIGFESQTVARWGFRPIDGPADWNGGTLFPQSSKKVARALNSASGNRPVVLLANLSGFDGSPESMRKLQLEYGAEIARAVVNFEGPIIFLVVSRYHGGAYVVFSQELNPNLRAIAVEGSFASVIGGGPAAAVVFGREVRARVSADPEIKSIIAKLGDREPAPDELEELERRRAIVLLDKQAEVAAEFDSIHTVERAKEVGSLEEIISAKSVRPFLISAIVGPS